VEREKVFTYNINITEYPSEFGRKSGLRRILPDKSCLRRIVFHKKNLPAGMMMIAVITFSIF